MRAALPTDTRKEMLVCKLLGRVEILMPKSRGAGFTQDVQSLCSGDASQLGCWSQISDRKLSARRISPSRMHTIIGR